MQGSGSASALRQRLSPEAAVTWNMCSSWALKLGPEGGKASRENHTANPAGYKAVPETTVERTPAALARHT